MIIFAPKMKFNKNQKIKNLGFPNNMIYLGNKDKKILSAKIEKTWLQYKENSTQTKFMKNSQHCYLHSNLIENYGVSPKR